jgi:hypothetical protein
MKKTFLTIFSVMGFISVLLLSATNVFAQKENDTIKEQVQTLSDKVDGIGERLTTAENDLYKLTKIKLSGYIQAQWDWFQDRSNYPYNSFSVRRARVKIQYEPVTGVAFVLQPDFSPAGVTVKDAYVQVNEPWMKTFSLWAGQFNRPNYEVEFSSSQREVPERSRVIRALYPGERAIGAKLEIAPPSIPLKFQLALLNGNDNIVIKDAAGVDINPKNKDFDNFKDLMGRLTYQAKLGNFGSLDFGVNGYFGYLKATTDTVLNSEYKVEKSIAVGKALNRNWVGAEMQLYMDILGGMAIKGEFMMGKNAYPGYSGKATVADPVQTSLSGDTLTMNYLTTTTTSLRPNIVRNFMGYYIYLTKNIGRKNQFAIRWDYYDPNTKLKGDQIGVVKYDASKTTTATTTETSPGAQTLILNNTNKNVVSNTYKSGIDDIAYGTLTMAWNYYFSDNIRFQLAYEYPMNEKTGVNSTTGKGNVTKDYTVNGVKGYNDYSKIFPQSTVTVRLQVRF